MPNQSLNEQLDEILAEYVVAEENGEPVSRDDLLVKHPEFADELKRFFADRDQFKRLASPLSPKADRQNDLPAKVRYFGDYELLEQIAHGGMGVVYKARQTSLNRIVAVKMIMAGHLAADADIQRFMSEAQTAAGLKHKSIVPIHEVGQQNGQYYFSMDLIDGRNLAQIVNDGLPPPREAARIVREAAFALSYAHNEGFVHRDIKPSNILLDASAEVHITDFGLALRVEGGRELTQTGQVVGTPSYMPPEQATAKREQVGPAADIYSLGAVLYEVLLGRPPFRAESAIETLRQVVDEEPVPPQQLNRAVPKDLETICLKSLQKEPHKRYASARELADELDRFITGMPIKARPIGRISRTLRWSRRQPVVSGLVLATACLLLCIAALTSFGYLRETTLRSELQALYTDLRHRQDENESLSRSLEQRERQKSQLDQEITSASKELMLLRIRMAGYFVKMGRLPEAERLLSLCPEDQRNWEWQLYKKQCQPVVDKLTSKQLNDLSENGLEIQLRGEQVHFLSSASQEGESSAKAVDRDFVFASIENYLGGFTSGRIALTAFAKREEPRNTAVAFEFRPKSSPRSGDPMYGVVILGGESNKLERIIPWTGGELDLLAFGSRERYLAGVSTTKLTGAIWDMAGPEKPLELGRNGYNIFHARFTPDGRYLLTGSATRGNAKSPYASSATDRRTLIQWDVATRQTLREWDVSDAHGVNSIGFDATGNRFAAAGREKTIVWDFNTGERLLEIAGGTGVALDPSGKWVARSGKHTSITAVGTQSEIASDLPGGTSVAFHPKGDAFTIVSGGTVYGYAFPSMKQKFSVDTLSSCTRLAYSPEGDRIAIGQGRNPGDPKLVDILESGTGAKLLSLIPTNSSYLFDVAFNSTGRLLATANTGSISIWDTETAENIASFRVEADPKHHSLERRSDHYWHREGSATNLAYTVNFSSRDEYLMAGWGATKHNNVLLWDVSNRFPSIARSWVKRDDE